MGYRPYVLIAILGIVGMVIMAGVGLGQFDLADDEDETEEVDTNDPEAIYQANCMNCHGGDLEGGAGPSLQDVSHLSYEELVDIIANGIDGTIMTGDYATDSEAEVIAEWLEEQ